jgi:quercetin dioxygenase-like cupin family protein
MSATGAEEAMRSRAVVGVLAAWVGLAVPVATAQDAVTFIPGDETRAAFTKGRPLTETDLYKVHASRRDAPGEAEQHARDTDIFYVLDGTATFVTGGTIADARTVAAGEVRGPRIEGGTARTLAKGDVIVIPGGVPHWFSGVNGTFLYYVVKVTQPERGNAR